MYSAHAASALRGNASGGAESFFPSFEARRVSETLQVCEVGCFLFRPDQFRPGAQRFRDMLYSNDAIGPLETFFEFMMETARTFAAKVVDGSLHAILEWIPNDQAPQRNHALRVWVVREPTSSDMTLCDAMGAVIESTKEKLRDMTRRRVIGATDFSDIGTRFRQVQSPEDLLMIFAAHYHVVSYDERALARSSLTTETTSPDNLLTFNQLFNIHTAFKLDVEPGVDRQQLLMSNYVSRENSMTRLRFPRPERTYRVPQNAFAPPKFMAYALPRHQLDPRSIDAMRRFSAEARRLLPGEARIRDTTVDVEEWSENTAAGADAVREALGIEPPNTYGRADAYDPAQALAACVSTDTTKQKTALQEMREDRRPKANELAARHAALAKAGFVDPETGQRVDTCAERIAFARDGINEFVDRIGAPNAYLCPNTRDLVTYAFDTFTPGDLHKIPIQDSSIDVYGNYLIYMADVITHDWQTSSCQQLLLLALQLRGDTYRHAKKLHANLLMSGDAAVSKSYVLSMLQECTVATRVVSSETARAHNVETDDNDRLTIRDDWDISVFQNTVNGGPRLAAELQEQLTMMQVNTLTYAQRDMPNGMPERTNRHIGAELIGCLFAATNCKISCMPPPLQSRFINAQVDFVDPPFKSQLDISTSSYELLPEFRERNERHFRFMRGIGIMHFLVEKFIETHVFPDIGLSGIAKVHRNTMEYFKQHNVQQKTTRLTTQIILLIRQITITRAILTLFCTPASTHANWDGKDWSVMADLIPYLYATYEDYVAAMGLLSFTLVDSRERTVQQALWKLYATRVREDYAFGKSLALARAARTPAGAAPRSVPCNAISFRGTTNELAAELHSMMNPRYRPSLNNIASFLDSLASRYIDSPEYKWDIPQVPAEQTPAKNLMLTEGSGREKMNMPVLRRDAGRGEWVSISYHYLRQGAIGYVDQALDALRMWDTANLARPMRYAPAAAPVAARAQRAPGGALFAAFRAARRGSSQTSSSASSAPARDPNYILFCGTSDEIAVSLRKEGTACGVPNRGEMRQALKMLMQEKIEVPPYEFDPADPRADPVPVSGAAPRAVPIAKELSIAGAKYIGVHVARVLGKGSASTDLLLGALASNHSIHTQRRKYVLPIVHDARFPSVFRTYQSGPALARVSVSNPMFRPPSVARVLGAGSSICSENSFTFEADIDDVCQKEFYEELSWDASAPGLHMWLPRAFRDAVKLYYEDLPESERPVFIEYPGTKLAELRDCVWKQDTGGKLTREMLASAGFVPGDEFTQSEIDAMLAACSARAAPPQDAWDHDTSAQDVMADVLDDEFEATAPDSARVAQPSLSGYDEAPGTSSWPNAFPESSHDLVVQALNGPLHKRPRDASPDADADHSQYKRARTESDAAPKRVRRIASSSSEDS